MPVCSHCKVDRPLSDFCRASNRASGHQAYCKGCSRAKSRACQKRLRQDPAYRQREVEQDNEQYRTDPLFRARRIARSRARHAFKRGDILWSPCPCGSKDSEMHHEDYSRPLEVTWLCKRCQSVVQYGPAPEVAPRRQLLGDPIADLLKRLDARKAPAPPAFIGPAKVAANSGRSRRVA